MKILFYGESPVIETGAGQVSKHLLHALNDLGHTITVVAINHPFESYDRDRYPYEIHPCPKDEMYNIDQAREHILTDEYDLLFLTGDINIVESFSDLVLQRKQERSFIYVALAAVDCDLFNPAYTRCLEIADLPATYSAYARKIAIRMNPRLAGRVKMIPLGSEPDVFFPLPEEERQQIRKEAFHCDPDTFLVVSVNRNQPRKDLGRVMYSFHCFHERYPASKLYMHAKIQDIGGNLAVQASALGLRVAGPDPEVMFANPNLSEMIGVSRESLNRIYNAADCCTSMSTGEAWGLTTTEAMAAQVPFIGPDNTAFPELLGRDRGFLVKSGGYDLWSIDYGRNEGPRELVSVVSMINALEHVYLNRESAQARARRARLWTLQHTWSHMREEWKDLISRLGIGSDGTPRLANVI